MSEHVVTRFANLQKIMRAGLVDLTEVEGVGEVRARAIKEGLSRLAETSILERYVYVLNADRRRTLPELETGPYEVDVEHITLKGADGTQVDAVHARPDGFPRSGLVLHPDIMGLRPLFDDLSRRLATHGFAVCAPEPFARAPVDVVSAPDPTARMAYVKELDDDLQTRRPRDRGRLPRRPRRRARGRGHGVLHGGHAGAQGRRDGPVRSRRSRSTG